MIIFVLEASDTNDDDDDDLAETKDELWNIKKYKSIKKPIPCVIARNVLNLKIGLSHGELFCFMK